MHRVKHSSNVDSYKTKSKTHSHYPDNSLIPKSLEKLHRKLRRWREWVYLPLKNITSLRKVVIASKVKSGSQAWGRADVALEGTLPIWLCSKKGLVSHDFLLPPSCQSSQKGSWRERKKFSPSKSADQVSFYFLFVCKCIFVFSTQKHLLFFSWNVSGLF